ncbi:MAG: hypothetical protein BJ554DRAFT_1440 [Olpidium bornovanus]|uniref:Uncharacterized protein n=1 Tax=Olpidium bornovanus TaxID=278681 RepID=A0A8H8DH74_9FUNG|nr:MAG: hypothetical protein BJ554DRAFT_1440 [Olpidium bornovanus]
MEGEHVPQAAEAEDGKSGDAKARIAHSSAEVGMRFLDGQRVRFPSTSATEEAANNRQRQTRKLYRKRSEAQWGTSKAIDVVNVHDSRREAAKVVLVDLEATDFTQGPITLSLFLRFFLVFIMAGRGLRAKAETNERGEVDRPGGELRRGKKKQFNLAGGPLAC